MTVVRIGTAALMLMMAAAPAAAQGADGQAPDGATTAWRRGEALVREQAAQHLAWQRGVILRVQRQGVPRASAPREYERWPEVSEVVSRMARLGRDGTFEMQSVAGDVLITGGRGDEVRIEATLRARHRSSSAARGLLREIRVEALERGGNVQLRTGQPRGRSVWTAVDYVITVPSRANVVVGLGAGNVRIRNVSGEIRAETADGDLAASDVSRLRHLRTMRGTIEVVDAQADELSATTVQGNLLVRNLKGRVLDLNSVNGDVRLIDVDTSRARLQTMAGDIEYAGPLSRSGRYELLTYSGNIRVTPSGGAGFDLEAYSVAGNVRSDYSLRRRDTPARPPRSDDRTIRGTWGDAGAALTVRSYSGDIVLVRR